MELIGDYCFSPTCGAVGIIETLQLYSQANFVILCAICIGKNASSSVPVQNFLHYVMAFSCQEILLNLYDL